MVLRRSAVSLAFVASAAVAACDTPAETASVADDAARVQDQAIRGGTIDENSTAVMGLLADGLGSCTGSLVAPNLVLTAFHCVADSLGSPADDCGDRPFGTVYDASIFGATTSTTAGWRLRDYDSVREVHVPPGVDDICNGDLAFLILDDNIPASEATPLIPRIDERVEFEEPYIAIGYGAPNSGTRRRAEGFTVGCDGVNCGALEAVGRYDWFGEGAICQGDSGGPALDERGRVIGVASRGDEACEIAIYADVIHHAEWMREVGERAALLGGYVPPTWVSEGVSHPSGDADWDGFVGDDDNCPDVANPGQLDRDGDGIGDECDDRDNAPRGGDCEVCDRCQVDEHCGTGLCMLTDADAGFCTEACTTDDDCAFNTICRELDDPEGSTRSVCVNDDYDDEGICPGAWICLDIEIPDPEGSGEGTGEGSGEGTGEGTGEGSGDGTGEGTGDGSGEVVGSGDGTGGGTGDGTADVPDTSFNPRSAASSGCAAGGSSLPGVAWFALGLVAVMRRRR